MTSELFYAVIKLVSGEEVMARVCSFIENNEILLVLDNPILVYFSSSLKNGAPLVRVTPWMTLTKNSTLIIRRDSVITMTEIKDESLIKIHERYVNETSYDDSTGMHSNRGNQVIKLDDARKKLEELFKIEETHNSLE